MTRRVRFDLVIGRVVRDERGHKVGRVHDVRVEEGRGALTVVECRLSFSCQGPFFSATL